MAAGSAMDDGALSELGDGSSEPASAICNTNQTAPFTLRERERERGSDVASRWVLRRKNPTCCSHRSAKEIKEKFSFRIRFRPM